MADFSTWDRDTLNQIAAEMSQKILDQEDEISDLRITVKILLTEPRRLVIKKNKHEPVKFIGVCALHDFTLTSNSGYCPDCIKEGRRITLLK